MQQGKEYEPKVGDRIRWSPYTRGYHTRSSHGTITKISAAGVVTSTIDGSEEKQLHRPSKWGRPYRFELMTPLEIAVEKWRLEAPRDTADPRIIIAARSYHNEEFRTRIEPRNDVDAATLRALADIALKFAAWLDAEPKE